MRLADEEEVEDPAVDPDVHPQRHLPGRRVERAELFERAPHAECRVAGPGRVRIAVEEEEERVASELHEPAAVRVGDREEPRERRAHHVRHLFCSKPPLGREALGHRGEARDVDERQGPVERAVPRVRGGSQPSRLTRGRYGMSTAAAACSPARVCNPCSPTLRHCDGIDKFRKGAQTRDEPHGERSEGKGANAAVEDEP